MTTAVSGTVLLAAVLFSSHYKMPSPNLAVQWMQEAFYMRTRRFHLRYSLLVRDENGFFDVFFIPQLRRFSTKNK
jgi:hypothetical protein